MATWPWHFFPLHLPIDHCLLTHDLTVEEMRVLPIPGSDHSAVVVSIFVPEDISLGR